jgi:hypothetical protein
MMGEIMLLVLNTTLSIIPVHRVQSIGFGNRV